MKVAVIGSREFNDYDLLESILDKETITLIISGNARGADSLSIRYARRRNIPFMEYPPNWSDLSHPDALIKTHPDGRKYDAKAGFRRNNDIIKDSDLVIAFWYGVRAGTLDSLQKAKKLNKKIKIIKYLLL